MRAAVRIIGEAANKLAEDTKANFPGIEWRKIVAFRHRIIHEYDKVNYERVWQIIINEVPELVDRLSAFGPTDETNSD